jgi:hypothetical protein
MKKILLLLFTFTLTSTIARSQDFTYGDVDPQDLGIKKYAKDTAARAVVLNEYGNAQITIASDEVLKVIYNYHVKIKIINTKGFDKGTVEIPLRILKYGDEQVNDLKGITTYTDENGNVQTTELGNKAPLLQPKTNTGKR